MVNLTVTQCYDYCIFSGGFKPPFFFQFDTCGEGNKCYCVGPYCGPFIADNCSTLYIANSTVAPTLAPNAAPSACQPVIKIKNKPKHKKLKAGQHFKLYYKLFASNLFKMDIKGIVFTLSLPHDGDKDLVKVLTVSIWPAATDKKKQRLARPIVDDHHIILSNLTIKAHHSLGIVFDIRVDNTAVEQLAMSKKDHVVITMSADASIPDLDIPHDSKSMKHGASK